MRPSLLNKHYTVFGSAHTIYKIRLKGVLYIHLIVDWGFSVLRVFNKDIHETASKIFSDGIMTLIMSIIITNSNISEEELEKKS